MDWYLRKNKNNWLPSTSSKKRRVCRRTRRRRPTSVLLLHAQLPLQGLPELPLSDQLHLQLRALQLVLLLLRPRILYGNPQQTLLGGTQARIDRLDTGP